MHKIKGNKWNKRLCKWIASFLTVTLLVNQSCFSALAEEYDEYEYIEDVTDTDIDIDEEIENSDLSDEVEENADEIEITIPEYDEEASIIEEEVIESDAEDAISAVSVGDIFIDGKIKYKIINDDINNLQVEVIWHTDMLNTSGTVNIPSTASDGTNTYAVVRIGDSAFNGYRNMTNITIPDSVTSIGKNAFNQCFRLENITLSKNIISIEDYAFKNCISLKSIVLPNGITSIGEEAFYECRNLDNITIPSSITTIKDETFAYCRSLKNITIPNSITSIGGYSFWVCDSLESITIPNSVTDIGYGAFSKCYALKSFTIPDGITSIKIMTFESCQSLTNITIPDTVSSIDDYAFLGCINLTNVKLLNCDINIGIHAFSYCPKLINLQIALPENITAAPTIQAECFENCPDDRYLTFLTKDGTTALSDSTTPTFEEALDFYNTGGDGYWYGWKISDVPFIPSYPVAIKVNKDDSAWSNCTKKFALSPDNGITFITDLNNVPNGTYTIYDIAEAASRAGYVNTGVTIEVKDSAVEATLDYYTVTFYSDDTVFDEQIILTNTMISAPSSAPAKDGYTFYRWVTSDSTEFTFGNPITSKTDIYASWIADDTGVPTTPPDTGENVTPSNPGDNTDDNNVPDTSNSADTDSNNSDSISTPAVVSDTNVISNTDIISINTAPASKDNEPKTGDASHMEVYATIAMIAGLSYLLLYFADGKNGMTEEEKKEIVSALIKWAKKGKRLRKYTALAVIFVILVYYHSIGKRTAGEWKAVYEK